MSQYGFPGSYRINIDDPVTGKPLTSTAGDVRCPLQLNQDEFPDSVLKASICEFNFAQYIQLLPESESNSILIDSEWQWGFEKSMYAHVSLTQNDSVGIHEHLHSFRLLVNLR